jgi:hypothetical protein
MQNGRGVTVRSTVAAKPASGAPEPSIASALPTARYPRRSSARMRRALASRGPGGRRYDGAFEDEGPWRGGDVSSPKSGVMAVDPPRVIGGLAPTASCTAPPCRSWPRSPMSVPARVPFCRRCRGRRSAVGGQMERLLPGQLWSAYMLQRACVGDIRAARMAGRSPAMAPMSSAEARPPAQASGGTTVAQCLVWA